jgi:DNA polymerase-1
MPSAKSNQLTCIVDGNNILLRSRAALGPLQTKDGILTAGVYGSILAILQLHKKFKFTDLVVTFDWGRSVFRQAVRPEYKAARLTEEKEEAAPQFKLFEEFLALINIPSVRVEGIEADDIMASLKTQIKGDKIILTGDHDLLQLVDHETLIAKPSTLELWDRNDVIAKYGLPPERLAEIWAIQGDPGDGIEGVKGIGPKTALKIVQHHGSMWDAIEEEPKCAGYGTRIMENFALIDLVHGSTGIHIEKNFETAFNPRYYPPELRKFFIKLEMHSLVRRFDTRSLWNVTK